ncbi:uncharacterized protein LOC128966180 [Oppia nitens]|uniref:uncharacterized protein LOC128966180 n=1 Tax=Oppia nitens TaxID=1686743 RepID=UPI0023DAE677|nr:uncharacterized protein LOC128966180 [Oppia nitens]
MYSDREVLRQKIKLLSDQGMSAGRVARELNCNIKTVKKWSNQDNFRHKYNTIQRKKMTPNTKRRVSNELKDKVGGSLRKCVRKLNMSSDYINRDKTISRRTVQRYLKSTKWGSIARKMKVKPLLTPKNIADRLKFANMVTSAGYCDNTRRGRELRENVLWTDESPIELFPKLNHQNTRIRTSDKTKQIVGRPKFPLKIMVAGGITASGKTELYVCPPKETIGGQVYESKILPLYLDAINDPLTIGNKRKATLCQDSAPGHNIRSVINKITSTYPNSWTVGKWPGNSPDFNLIEPVWSVLKDSVHKNPIPKNRDQLIRRVRETWNSLNPDYLKKLVHSFPNRIKQAIDNCGGNTDY